MFDMHENNAKFATPTTSADLESPQYGPTREDLEFAKRRYGTADGNPRYDSAPEENVRKGIKHSLENATFAYEAFNSLMAIAINGVVKDENTIRSLLRAQEEVRRAIDALEERLVESRRAFHWAFTKHGCKSLDAGLSCIGVVGDGLMRMSKSMSNEDRRKLLGKAQAGVAYIMRETVKVYGDEK